VPDVNSATASVSTFQAVAASAFLVPEPGWLSALVLVPVLLRRSARG